MRWRGISQESKNETHPSSRHSIAAHSRKQRPLRQPADTTAVHERAIAISAPCVHPNRALAPGALMPAFSLRDQQDNTVSSASLLGHGKLMITFFRGRWCPYCVTTLESLQFIYADLARRGASLIAVSPQKVQQNFLTADQHHLRFPLLSDPGNDVARAFGIAYTVPAEQAALYRSVFVNLEHLNEDAPDTLPLPATFVVAHRQDRARVCRCRFPCPPRTRRPARAALSLVQE